jgi:hypothetical protein
VQRQQTLKKTGRRNTVVKMSLFNIQIGKYLSPWRIKWINTEGVCYTTSTSFAKIFSKNCFLRHCMILMGSRRRWKYCMNNVTRHLPIFTVFCHSHLARSNNVSCWVANNKPVTWCSPWASMQHHVRPTIKTYYVLRFKVTIVTDWIIFSHAVGGREVRLPPIWLPHELSCLLWR